MMNHDEIREKLFNLYDRPLTQREKRLVESHLPDCPECRQAFEEWQRISHTLFSQPALSEEAEDRFVAKVMKRVQKPAGSPFWSGLKWFVPLAGSALSAVWVFFYVLPNNPELLQPPLTMSLLNSAQAEVKTVSARVPQAVRPARPLPTLRFNPIARNAVPAVPVYRLLRPQNPPADPFVQAVVYSY